MRVSQVVEQLSGVLCRQVCLVEAGDGRAGRSGWPPRSPTAGSAIRLREIRRDGQIESVDVSFDGGASVLRIERCAVSKLTPLDWVLIDAAVYLLELELGTQIAVHGDITLTGLLAEERAVRRDALWEIRARRGVDRFNGEIQVIATLLDGVCELEVVAIGRHLTSKTHGHVQFIGIQHDAAIFISAPTLAESLIETVQHEAAARGAVVRGMATAACAADAPVIDDAVGRAIQAARLRATLPGDVASVRSEDLGGWALIQTVPRSVSLLHQASPAALALVNGEDPVQRQTVEVYLDAAGRPAVACERLRIHRTTLYYRLDHLPDCVQEALADGLQRSTLHLALKLVSLWEQDSQHAVDAIPTGPFSVRDERSNERLPA